MDVLIQAGTYECSCDSGTATVHVKRDLYVSDLKSLLKLVGGTKNDE